MRGLWLVGACVLLTCLVSLVVLLQPDPRISAFGQAVDPDHPQQTTAPLAKDAERR